MAGITSAASLAAQSGPTYFVTSDASGHLATSNVSVNTLTSNVAALQQGFIDLQRGVNQAYEGTAIAISMGASALPDNKTFAVTTNWGNFRGTNAMSLVGRFN
jgi:hypothetical protein